MKKIFAIISLAALMMPVSCMKDELAGLDNSGAAGKTMTFKAVMETPGTKTTISIDGNQGNVAWAAGDALKFDYEIGMVDSEPVLSSVLAEGDIKDGVATFKADVPEVFGMTAAEYKETLEEGATNSRHMYVAYPSTVETTYEASAYTVTIPTVQDGTFANASIALAKWNPNKPNDPLEFRNLCGLIQVTVGENVRQIKLTSSGYIAGKANVGFVDTYVPNIKNMIEAEASKVITVNVTEAGTYYIAVKPGTLSDFCLALYDAEGKLLGDKAAKTQGSVAVERAHVLPLGLPEADSFVTADASVMFVTPEGRGTGDGSSWNNAASYATFIALCSDDKVTSVRNAYFSEGNYSTTMKALGNGVGVNMYGGYPADAICCDLSRRDVEKYPSMFDDSLVDDGGTDNRLWNIRNAGVWGIDGFVFKNFAKNDAGGVLQITGVAQVVCKNCVFENNSAGTTGGGAVYLSALTSDNVVFENCKFVENKATKTSTTNQGLGGAVVAAGNPSTIGTVTFIKCLFERNSAGLSGGAICPRAVNSRFEECIFVDNTAKYGDAIHVENTKTVSAYFNGCNFYSTSSGYVKSKMISITNENSVVGLNNCVIMGAWGLSAGKGGQLENDGKTCIMVNSTLFAQTGDPIVYTKANATTHILNSIVLNAASSGQGRAVDTTDDGGKSYLYNSIFTKADDVTPGTPEVITPVTATTNSTAFGATLTVKSYQVETFPVDPTWYGSKDSAALMWGNKNSTTTSVDDCRGKYYYYAWDGVYPEGATFTNATLTQVEEWVKAADADFATWLGDRLGKDIRGVSRDASSMWPGSYQE